MPGQFNYNKVLVIGATSGIGKAMAEKLIDNGIKVIVSGRRKENLDQFIEQHGKDKAEAVQFDITELDKIPQFTKDVTASHPDLDCVIINSGIQRTFNFADANSVDLKVVGDELTTNYLSYVHLSMAFLPHMQKQEKPTSLIYTSSGLALVPSARNGNYSASKAALHAWLLAFRYQCSKGPGNVKIVELFPPAVQTELHDAKHQPSIKDGHKIGIPLDEYTNTTWDRMVEGQDQIPVGMSEKNFYGWEQERQKAFQGQCAVMEKMFAAHT